MQIQHQLGCQGMIPQRPDALHRVEVVEDHPLGAVPRRPAAPDHRLGPIPRRGGALHLGGGDRLLHQGTQQVPITGGAGGDGLRGHHAGAGLPIDVMKPLKQQRQGCAPTGELLRQPPLLVAQPLGRGAMAQLIPVQVTIPFHHGGQAGEQRQRLLKPAAALHQLLQRGWLVGQPGGQEAMNFKLNSN